MNKITLNGTIETEPTFSHEVCGEKFFEFELCVARQSGVFDILICNTSETLLPEDTTQGTQVTIFGEIRTRNIHSHDGDKQKNRLHVFVFVKDIVPYDENAGKNIVELDGFICKPPVYRQTPYGREIADVLIACNRPYGKSDYIPTIAWGRNARRVGKMEVGTHIRVEGRMQSREYLKQYGDGTCVDKVAYELSASRIKEVREEE